MERRAWGQGQASLSQLCRKPHAWLPLTKTKLVQVCSFPFLSSFISFFFQEKLHRFKDDSEFNMVYENL